MPTNALRNKVAALLAQQSVRYLINGLAATAVHFVVLTFNLKILSWDSAGIANLVAAVFGISVSFLGSRYFVFQGSVEPLLKQMYRFIFLYKAIALLHGALMYVWACKSCAATGVTSEWFLKYEIPKIFHCNGVICCVAIDDLYTARTLSAC